MLAAAGRPLLEGRALLRLQWRTRAAYKCSNGSSTCRRAFRGARPPLQHAQQQRRPLWTPAAAGPSAHAQPQVQQQEQGQEKEQQQPHISVLLQEVLGFFEGVSVERYVDGTLGAAGHASEVLRCHPELITLVGFDLDTSAHTIAAARLEGAGARVVRVVPARGPGGAVTLPAEFQRPAGGGAGSSSEEDFSGSGGLLTTSSPPTAFIVHSNFGAMGPVLAQLRGGALAGAVDAVLLDLGMSSMQVDESERGFSFIRDGPLDMRMDPSGAQRSAEELVNTASEVELGRIIRDLGEERYWKGIARRIVAAREEEPILTTQQLVRAIGNPGGGGKGSGRRRDAKQKHPATRVFQALRIAVNDELVSIARALPDAIDCLRPGGRLAVITFHSLEDRIVKWAFRQAAGMAPSDEELPSYCVPFDRPLDRPLVKILTRRPVVPSEEEQAANSRSRSAKLRVVERL